jgi:hypothetical protein
MSENREELPSGQTVLKPLLGLGCSIFLLGSLEGSHEVGG